MTELIEIRGLDKLAINLAVIKNKRVIQGAIKSASAHIARVVKVYPPSSDANNPNSRQWYERGWGSKWRVRSGEIHGSKSSKDLRAQWTTATENDGLTGIIGNNVSYAPYVHDPDDQTWYHKARGWKTTEQVAQQEADVVVNMISAAIARALK